MTNNRSQPRLYLSRQNFNRIRKTIALLDELRASQNDNPEIYREGAAQASELLRTTLSKAQRRTLPFERSVRQFWRLINPE